MEISVKDEHRQRLEQYVYEDATEDCIHFLIANLQTTALAIGELAVRLRTQYIKNTQRNEGTQLACQVLEGIEVDYADIVHDAMQRLGLELVDDEQIVDRVRQEVARRVGGLTQLMG
jgi:hypothetical protein